MLRIFFFQPTWSIQKKFPGRGYSGTGWNIAEWARERSRLALARRFSGEGLQATGTGERSRVPRFRYFITVLRKTLPLGVFKPRIVGPEFFPAWPECP